MAKPGQLMAMNGDMVNQNWNTPVIKLSKADGGKVGPIPTTLVNKDIEEVDQQVDQPKVTILHPKEHQDQGIAIKKHVKMIFKRLTHKMTQHLKYSTSRDIWKEFL